VDKQTVEVYDARGADWATRRTPVRRAAARAFAATVVPGAPRVDLGCGAGRYSADLGHPVIGIDASHTMLELCRVAAPDALLVRGDLEALPFGRRSLGGGWANMSYLHVASTRLPLALADLHGVLAPGAPLDLQVLVGDYEGNDLPGDDIGGRFFAAWPRQRLLDVMVGAGFDVTTTEIEDDVVRVGAQRARTLADTVAGGMRLLVVGLNPSIYAADAGVGYARPGNRFWPAALGAGLVTRDRDALHALRSHGVGMTDVVKRATSGAGELTVDEYRHGMGRVERLVRWLAPGAVCFVGLAAWRAAIDRRACAGRQPRGIGGRPAYVMPSTSGANAHARPDDLREHLRSALDLACSASRGG